MQENAYGKQGRCLVVIGGVTIERRGEGAHQVDGDALDRTPIVADGKKAETTGDTTTAARACPVGASSRNSSGLARSPASIMRRSRWPTERHEPALLRDRCGASKRRRQKPMSPAGSPSHERAVGIAAAGLADANIGLRHVELKPPPSAPVTSRANSMVTATAWRAERRKRRRSCQTPHHLSAQCRRVG